MKKFIGVLTVIMVAQITNAQDFKKVQTSVLINQFESAKSDYDKIIAKKPTAATTPEGYYWKARIYSGLAKDPKNTTALNEVKPALDAYIISEDASTKFGIAKENGTEPFFDVYLKNFREGVSSFNEKNWKQASAQFNDAVKYSDIIFSNGWATTKQKFDTTSLMYAGFANQNAGNVDQTIVYYKRIIDAEIKSSDVLDVYKYVLLQYINKKDKASFDALLPVAESAYPKENWFDFKSEYIEKNYNVEEKIKLFDERNASGNITESECLMFGDAFMAAKNEDANANNDQLVVKAAESYKKAFTLNNKNFAAAFNAGISYYNQYTVLDEKTGDNIRALQTLNANKPAAPKDPKKKLAFDAAFKAQQDSIKKLNVALEPAIKEKVDASIEWIEKAFNSLKDKEKLERIEKNIVARSVDFLATLYQYKSNKARGKDQKAADEYDAKFNFYDKLHDKYNN